MWCFGHKDKRGVDRRRLCFDVETDKKEILAGSCRPWDAPVPRLRASYSYLCIYLANFGGTLGVTFFF